MSKQFLPVDQVLQDDDIIDSNNQGSVHRKDVFVQYLNDIFRDYLISSLISYLINKKGVSLPDGKKADEFGEDGVECKVLKTDGKGWKKAKMRFRLVLEIEMEDFEVEAVDVSPLDDIRQSISNN